jgi:Ca2+-binding EF-hand superfamily protein
LQTETRSSSRTKGKTFVLLQELITIADKDGSGSLDFPEFLNMMKEKVENIDFWCHFMEVFLLFS